jgi:hypothetical protein
MLTGPAKILPRDDDENGGVKDVELQGKRVILDLSGGFSVDNGDFLAVTVEPMTGGLRGLTYRNVTRSINGKSWVTAPKWGSIFWLLCFAAFSGYVAFDRPLSDPWSMFGFALGVMMLLFVFRFLLDHLFRWRLYREAYQRTAEACADLAKGEA